MMERRTAFRGRPRWCTASEGRPTTHQLSCDDALVYDPSAVGEERAFPGCTLNGSVRDDGAAIMKTVLVISFTNLAGDPRVNRQLRWLAGRYRVIAAGLGDPRLDG